MLNFHETADQENENVMHLLGCCGMNIYQMSSCMKNIHLEIVKNIFKGGETKQLIAV